MHIYVDALSSYWKKLCKRESANKNRMTGFMHNKGNNKITELRTILQRESQNS
jgi:hypothetical protein